MQWFLGVKRQLRRADVQDSGRRRGVSSQPRRRRARLVRALSQVTGGVGGLECPLGRPVGDGQQGPQSCGVVCWGGNSQLARRHRRAPGACRGQLQRAQNRSGAAEHRCTGLYTAGRGLCSNVGAEMAAEASGGVAAAAVRGRVAGRAVRQAGRARRAGETGRGRADADRSAAGSARWMRPCCGCEGEDRGWRSDGAGKSRCKSGFSLAPRPT